MITRKLDNSGLEIPALVLGDDVFGWTANEGTSLRPLGTLLDAGLNYVGTADVYSRWIPGHRNGEPGTLTSEWSKRIDKRDRMVIASKVEIGMSSDHKGLFAAYIEQVLERSLRHLQIGYLNLYQSHTNNPYTDLKETPSTYDELIKKGRVRVTGASNYDVRYLPEVRQISARLNLPGYQSLQPGYNLYDHVDHGTNLEPMVGKPGIGAISYYSLASGFLSDKYHSQADAVGQAWGEEMKGYPNERGVAILTVLDEVAEQYNANPIQVALAWLIACPTVTALIASATSLRQLDGLIAVTHLKLDEQAIHCLGSASAYRSTCRRGRPRPVERNG